MIAALAPSMRAERLHRLGSLVALLLLMAALANGTPFLLARSGLIAPEAYQRDRQAYCPQAGPPRGLVSACSPLRAARDFTGSFDRLSLERLHAPPRLWAMLKAGPPLLLLGLPLTALWWMVRGRWPWPPRCCFRPVLPLLGSIGLSVALAFPLASSEPLLWALRGQAWLLPLVGAGPFSQPVVLGRVAQAMAVLQLLQLPLMLIEAVRGLPISFGLPADQFAQAALGLPTRLVGSFIQPNSLGVAMVALLGFCIVHLPYRRVLPALALLGLAPLLLARSATGLLAWVVVVVHWGCSGRRLPRALGLGLSLLLAALVAALPMILGRMDLWQSLSARVSWMASLLRSSDLWQWMFGHGLLSSSPTDSLPALLLLQGGLLALLGFYGLMLWAWRRDPGLAPFLLAVLLGGLTLPITELFPINLLLALSLNNALCSPLSAAAPAASARPDRDGTAGRDSAVG